MLFCCCFTIVWNFWSTIKRTYESNTIFPKFFVSIERRKKKVTKDSQRGLEREGEGKHQQKITAKQKIVCNYFVDKLHVFFSHSTHVFINKVKVVFNAIFSEKTLSRKKSEDFTAKTEKNERQRTWKNGRSM